LSLNGSEGRPLILVTNDDGFHAPGIGALAEVMRPLGEIMVVAPERGVSGASHALTLDRPLRVRRQAPSMYQVDGTPTDCVHLAVYRLLDGRRPDLVVSGINRGLNIGDDVTYSGTVAGAMEGCLMDIPSLAFSLEIDGETDADYSRAADTAATLSLDVLRRGLPNGIFLNVNIPTGIPLGTRVTRQGKRAYRASTEERRDPAGKPYYWVGRNESERAISEGDDHRAIDDRYVSVTPLSADLTSYDFMNTLSEWDLQ
jgi:5'-nucleotidase